ncbi:IS3 family transposase [Streptomyces triticisoli]|jgi:putative transposase|uniref:IS3 family transposase n=1 Tax=Streptomyces triticisoli TaxID=2182797 RepID=UPI000DD7083B|nr:IS3 family transposase [Streptomyces triticisoli]
MRDEELKERTQEVHTSNHRVYGARKIWRELNRQEHAVARCTVECLMRELGTQGAVRGKRAITTIPGGRVERAPTWSTATSSPALRTAAGWRASPM